MLILFYLSSTLCIIKPSSFFFFFLYFSSIFLFHSCFLLHGVFALTLQSAIFLDCLPRLCYKPSHCLFSLQSSPLIQSTSASTLKYPEVKAPVIAGASKHHYRGEPNCTEYSRQGGQNSNFL